MRGSSLYTYVLCDHATRTAAATATATATRSCSHFLLSEEPLPPPFHLGRLNSSSCSNVLTEGSNLFQLGLLSGSGEMEIPRPVPGNQLQRPQIWPPLQCPRCDSANTKFCYFNNYSRLQPRYLCKACRRHWTEGGTLRNVPVRGRSKNKRNKATTSKATTAAATTATTAAATGINSSSINDQLLLVGFG